MVIMLMSGVASRRWGYREGYSEATPAVSPLWIINSRSRRRDKRIAAANTLLSRVGKILYRSCVNSGCQARSYLRGRRFSHSSPLLSNVASFCRQMIPEHLPPDTDDKSSRHRWQWVHWVRHCRCHGLFGVGKELRPRRLYLLGADQVLG